ncbi:HNH endonuclease signature motif containing protein [Agromyces albus]|uniref:HNH endonuclease signature motif containing protein n=1 Tax=Agromyces albus TaxID=205332 RepID=UPI0013E93840|nr:HNH endonuclease signature motif containing protein [Agromyces albus]
MAELIEAAVQAQRIEAMNAAMQVDVIFLTVGHALRSEEAFVPNTLSAQRRREMAHRSVTAELATALHVPERTMERQISEAWALSTTLPATLRAMRNGQISSRHAAVIVQETTDLDDDPGLRARLDEQLAIIATGTTAATLRVRARALREKLGIESLEARHRAARAERRVELETARDGMAWLHAFLPAEDALLIKDRLDRIARAAGDGHGDGACGDSGGDDARSRDQLRADATRDLLLHGRLADESVFADAAATVQPTVHVTVPVLTLAGHSADPGELDGYGPIDAAIARRLAAMAPSFTRLLTHPVSGTVLDVDRASYRPPADLKRWLEVRDGGCRFPGCNRRAAGCEVDHSVDWQHEGRTAFDNLAHLCALHHHLKHESSWSVQHMSGGVLEWTSPAGRTHVTHPRRSIPVGVGSNAPASSAAGSISADSTGPPPRLDTTNESPPF